MAETKKKILVVEDEAVLLELYTVTLRGNGYEVMTAEDGDKALEVLKDNTFDLILLDIMLPGKDGLEVLKTIKEDPTYEHQSPSTIMMLTNLNQDQVISQAILAGARGYLVKSDYNPDQFLEAVKTTFS
ncbi:response regulator [Microgenomates group bacterium]|nr:response regulator [Microgenomates group bacterium]